MPVKWQQSGIILIWIFGPLLEVKGEECETVCVGGGLVLSAGKTQPLHDLEPTLSPETIVSQNGIQEINLGVSRLLILGGRKQRWDGPLTKCLPFFGIKEGTESFGPFTWFQSQTELMIPRAGGDFVR